MSIEAGIRMLTVAHKSSLAHALPASSIARLKPAIDNIEIHFNGECWLKYLVNHRNFTRTRTAFSKLEARYNGYPAGKTASGGNVVACIILRTKLGSVEVLCLQKYPDIPVVVFTTLPPNAETLPSSLAVPRTTDPTVVSQWAAPWSKGSPLANLCGLVPVHLNEAYLGHDMA